MLQGKFIGAEETNTFALEKKFTAKAVKKAVLEITALGLYFAEINGKRVGDAYMTPGFTSYNKMLQKQTYDVTDLIKEGENVITLNVGEGWYCCGFGWRRNFWYGKKSAVLAELDLDGTKITTDKTWTAKESYIRYSSIYDGETQDFKTPCKTLTACEVEFDKTKIVDQICEPVKNIERIKVKKVLDTKGGKILDFGQNLTGVIEIKTPEDFDGTFTVKFAEILIHGEFFTDNLRAAKATDTFTVKGQRTLTTEFTFHGFRYVKIIDAEFPISSITAVVRHTDLKKTGSIEVDNKRFQRLMDNVVWSQRDNYLDIPTDCPQRDERLGWTGDANAFLKTAAFNYDIRKFFKKWLADLRNDQGEDGTIPVVAPDVLNFKQCAALWCDSIVMIPWKLYEVYGDKTYLSDNFDAMKKYLSAQERNLRNGIVGEGFQYADWLALDGETYKPSEHTFGRTDVFYLASAFFYHCIRTVEKIAKILGNKEDQKLYNKKGTELLKNIRKEYFTPNGKLAVDTITAHVLALAFGLVEDKFKERIANKLNAEVIAHEYHVTTGFIGTTYLLFVLADNGFIETASKVLFVEGMPGWLYEVDMGATTTWERWNSLMPDGNPNPNGMNSYNHYAYGSVMEFVYRRIAGIESTSIGYRTIKICPYSVDQLNYIKGEYKSVRGKIVSGYKKEGDKITYFAEVPKKIKAEIWLPGEGKVAEGSGKFTFERIVEKKEEKKD